MAIDLEWRPDFGAGQSRVALMQLATSSCAVLIRTCRLKHQLPPVLAEFLRWARSHAAYVCHPSPTCCDNKIGHRNEDNISTHLAI